MHLKKAVIRWIVFMLALFLVLPNGIAVMAEVEQDKTDPPRPGLDLSTEKEEIRSGKGSSGKGGPDPPGGGEGSQGDSDFDPPGGEGSEGDGDFDSPGGEGFEGDGDFDSPGGEGSEGNGDFDPPDGEDSEGNGGSDPAGSGEADHRGWEEILSREIGSGPDLDDSTNDRQGNDPTADAVFGSLGAGGDRSEGGGSSADGNTASSNPGAGNLAGWYDIYNKDAVFGGDGHVGTSQEAYDSFPPYLWPYIQATGGEFDWETFTAAIGTDNSLLTMLNPNGKLLGHPLLAHPSAGKTAANDDPQNTEVSNSNLIDYVSDGTKGAQQGVGMIEFAEKMVDNPKFINMLKYSNHMVQMPLVLLKPVMGESYSTVLDVTNTGVETGYLGYNWYKYKDTTRLGKPGQTTSNSKPAGKPSQGALKALPKVGGVFGGIGFGLDSYEAYQQFKQGNTVDGIGASMGALGSLGTVVVAFTGGTALPLVAVGLLVGSLAVRFRDQIGDFVEFQFNIAAGGIELHGKVHDAARDYIASKGFKRTALATAATGYGLKGGSNAVGATLDTGSELVDKGGESVSELSRQVVSGGGTVLSNQVDQFGQNLSDQMPGIVGDGVSSVSTWSADKVNEFTDQASRDIGRKVGGVTDHVSTKLDEWGDNVRDSGNEAGDWILENGKEQLGNVYTVYTKASDKQEELNQKFANWVRKKGSTINEWMSK